MTNTVIVSGKGISAGVFLRNLQKKLGGLYTTELKWYHRDTRHKLRLQNLTSLEILAIKDSMRQGKLRVELEIF